MSQQQIDELFNRLEEQVTRADAYRESLAYEHAAEIADNVASLLYTLGRARFVWNIRYSRDNGESRNYFDTDHEDREMVERTLENLGWDKVSGVKADVVGRIVGQWMTPKKVST